MMYDDDIKELVGYEILDSRGNPTVECEVHLNSGVCARASVPSGASTGSQEAIELRDGNKRRYGGKGVMKSVELIFGEISEALSGFEVFDQVGIDQCLIDLDGTNNKSRLGSNTTLAVSLAVAKAAAKFAKMPLYRYLGGASATYLPVPMMNIINGGAHADNNLNIQEFMIIPTGTLRFSEALRMGSEIFQTLKSILRSKKLSTAVGDEGGFAPDVKTHTQALDLIVEAINKAGYAPGRDVYLGLDCAASEFYKDEKYRLTAEKKTLSSKGFIDLLESWCDKYPILSIEDPMSEDDWDGWALITERLGKRIQLVGDDLFVTNPDIIKEGIQEGLANSVLIKPNQIGTLTETFKAIQVAKQAGYTTIISHRSGETEDTSIADLAVATNSMQIKTGSLSRTDRTAKYNQLLRIERELSDHAYYPGIEAFYNLKNV